MRRRCCRISQCRPSNKGSVLLLEINLKKSIAYILCVLRIRDFNTRVRPLEFCPHDFFSSSAPFIIPSSLREICELVAGMKNYKNYNLKSTLDERNMVVTHSSRFDIVRNDLYMNSICLAISYPLQRRLEYTVCKHCFGRQWRGVGQCDPLLGSPWQERALHEKKRLWHL